MRTFEKSKILNSVSYEIRGPVADEADRLIAEGNKVLKLNTGNPEPFGFRAPDSLLQAMKDNIIVAEGYSDARGLAEARAAIKKYADSKGIPNVEESEILTGNGVSELISMTMQALLDSGDEILIPSPDYPLWTGAATLGGGKVVHYICDEQADWMPDLDDIKKKINSNTKAIVIINPNNPTGAVYPKEFLLELAEVARQNELIIFADEIYDRLVYDGVGHTSIASLAPDLFVVTFNGLSKSHMVAGFRSGWLTMSGDKEKARSYMEGVKLLASMRMCANVPAQSTIKAALEDAYSADKLIEPGGRLYEQRELIYNAVKDIPGISVVKPKAAFYMFPKIDTKKFNITSDSQFVLDFLHKSHILVTHGTGYNWKKPDHFRIVFLPDVDDLKIVGSELSEFLKDYRQ